MPMGQAQDLPLQGWHRRTSAGATLVAARSKLLMSKTQCPSTCYRLRMGSPLGRILSSLPELSGARLPSPESGIRSPLLSR
jgi:hypothetical protein